MKNITKKLVASVLSLGVLFSGLGSVQATTPTTTINLTWEVWDNQTNFPVGGFHGWWNTLVQPFIGESAFTETTKTMTSTYDEPYTYAVVIEEDDFVNWDGRLDMYGDKGYINNIVATGGASTIEEAESEATELAQQIADDWNTEKIYKGNDFTYVAPVKNRPIINQPYNFSPTYLQLKEELDQGNNGNAYGHDKGKAQGKAVGHNK